MEGYFYILVVLILWATYTDLTTNTIPNCLTVSGVVSGLVYHALSSGVSGFISSIFGVIVGLSIFGFIYLFRGVGAGDVKLFVAIGAMTNTKFVMYASIYAILYAGGIGLLILIYKGLKQKQDRSNVAFLNWIFPFIFFKKIEWHDLNKAKKHRFPFMYAVVPGIITTYYYVVMS